MSFEKFIPRRMSWGEPIVTISPVRTFWINASAAREFFEGFSRTFLLYDAQRRVIGFEPTNERINCFVLSRAKTRESITVSGMAFLPYHGIPSDKTRRYKAIWNDKENLVEIDLNKPI